MKKTPLTGSTIKSELNEWPVVAQVPSDWDESKDLEYYRDIYGTEEGDSTPRAHMLEKIEENHLWLMDTLDDAASVVWNEAHPLPTEVLALLSAEAKIALLRKLIQHDVYNIPRNHQANYLAHFEEQMDRCADVERLRNRVLTEYLFNPTGTWLRELIQVNDGMLSALTLIEEASSWKRVESEEARATRTDTDAGRAENGTDPATAQAPSHHLPKQPAWRTAVEE